MSARRCPTLSLFHLDLGYHRHACAQSMVRVLVILKDDLYRNPLDDLDIITSCVLRRQEAESRSTGAANAVHVSLVFAVERVHVDAGFLSYTHFSQLRLLKVRRYPDVVQRN